MRFGLGHIHRHAAQAVVDGIMFFDSNGNVALSNDGVSWSVGDSVYRNSSTPRGFATDGSSVCLLYTSGASNERLVRSLGSDGYVGALWRRCTTEGLSFTGITWAPSLSLYIAVAQSGTNRVATSGPALDGFLHHAPASAVQWQSVDWSEELGIAVAVANDGSVMTSTNGTSWTSRTASVASAWRAVKWCAGLGLFIAVATSGSGARIMTSPDGINWTSRTASVTDAWREIIWSEELGLALVLPNASSTNAMWSEDGINWNTITLPTSGRYVGVWAPTIAKFVIVCSAGTNRVLTSSDGKTFSAASTDLDSFSMEVGGVIQLDYRLTQFVYTSGSGTITAPDYDELYVEATGAAGGTGAVSVTAGTSGTNATNGGASTITVGTDNLVANGSNGTQTIRNGIGSTTGTAGGTATGPWDVASTGNTGNAGIQNAAWSGVAAGRGNSHAFAQGFTTDLSGEPSSNNSSLNGFLYKAAGQSARPPTARGASASNEYRPATAGGGGFGYKKYTKGVGQAPSVGGSISYSVGAGGLAGTVTGGTTTAPGLDGNNGRVRAIFKNAA